MLKRHPVEPYRSQLNGWLNAALSDLEKAQSFLALSEDKETETEYLVAQAMRLIEQAKEIA